MDRPDSNMLHQWHVAINSYHYNDGFSKKNERQSWMYDAKNVADELPRLVMLFKAERLGELPKLHQQCSHSEPEPVIDNHLSCCMGVKCQECPFLLSLEKAEVPPEQLDELKAWTCMTHILTEKSKKPFSFDDSEGYILTVDDKIFWQRVYESLSHANEPPDSDEDEGSVD